jgi:hypothetical protein
MHRALLLVLGLAACDQTNDGVRQTFTASAPIEGLMTYSFE